MAVFAVVDDPLTAVSGGSSAITFLVLPEVFCAGPGGPVVQLAMVTMFFLALSFAALTSMISTVGLCQKLRRPWNRETSSGRIHKPCNLLLWIAECSNMDFSRRLNWCCFPQFLEFKTTFGDTG